MSSRLAVTAMLGGALVAGCGGSEEKDYAFASIINDFNNPAMSFQPPWTICRASYLGTDFSEAALAAGQVSAEKQVKAGLDNVLMVAAWADPTCAAAHALPIASKNEEEILPDQHRSIAINLPNHQGACPPEGTAPIPAALYGRILALWPEFGFLPYDQRTFNPQCVK